MDINKEKFPLYYSSKKKEEIIKCRPNISSSVPHNILFDNIKFSPLSFILNSNSILLSQIELSIFNKKYILSGFDNETIKILNTDCYIHIITEGIAYPVNPLINSREEIDDEPFFKSYIVVDNLKPNKIIYIESVLDFIEDYFSLIINNEIY
jgi:hypothetical protein